MSLQIAMIFDLPNRPASSESAEIGRLNSVAKAAWRTARHGERPLNHAISAANRHKYRHWHQKSAPCLDRNASSKRPGLPFDFSTGTRPGSVALVPNDVGRKEDRATEEPPPALAHLIPASPAPESLFDSRHQSQKGCTMRIYIFKSETRRDLHAFAGDLMGSKLPENHGPWTATGAIGPDKAPPHNFSRDAIQSAIDGAGFQLWRVGKKVEASA
jgi:hypothetical protein